MANMLTEDEVRSLADSRLNMVASKDMVAGTGQITTFNQLGARLGMTFNAANDKPAGWWLPRDKSQPAMIAEFKASDKDITTAKCVDELRKNVRAAFERQNHICPACGKAFADVEEGRPTISSPSRRADAPCPTTAVGCARRATGPKATTEPYIVRMG